MIKRIIRKMLRIMDKELDRITEQRETAYKENSIFKDFDNKFNEGLKRHEEFIKSIKK